MDIAELLGGMWIWYLQGAVAFLGLLIMGIRLILYVRLEQAIRRGKTGRTEHRFLMGITRAFQVDNPVKNREKVDNFVDNYLFIHRLGVFSLKNGNFQCGQFVNYSGLFTLILLGLGFYIKADWNVIGTIFFAGMISSGGLFCIERIINFPKIQERIRCGLMIHLEREQSRTDTISDEFEKKRMKSAVSGVKSQADQLIRLSKEENTVEQEETIAERVAREIMQGKAREESIAERIRNENSDTNKEFDEKIAAGLEHEIPEATVLNHMDPVEQVAKMTVDLAVEKTARRIREQSEGQENHVKQPEPGDYDTDVHSPSTACTQQKDPETSQLSGHDRQLIHDFLCNLTTR